jgi:hypothetical protein
MRTGDILGMGRLLARWLDIARKGEVYERKNSLLVVRQVKRTLVPPKTCIVSVNSTLEEACGFCRISSSPFSTGLLKFIRSF